MSGDQTPEPDKLNRVAEGIDSSVEQWEGLLDFAQIHSPICREYWTFSLLELTEFDIGFGLVFSLFRIIPLAQ